MVLGRFIMLRGYTRSGIPHTRRGDVVTIEGDGSGNGVFMENISNPNEYIGRLISDSSWVIRHTPLMEILVKHGL